MVGTHRGTLGKDGAATVKNEGEVQVYKLRVEASSIFFLHFAPRILSASFCFLGRRREESSG